MSQLAVLSTFLSLIILVDRPHNVSAKSDLPRRSVTDRSPPSQHVLRTDKLDDPDVGAVVTSACSDVESHGSDRYYIRELLEDVGGEHVTVATHNGQLRGIRIRGLPAAG